MAKYRHRIFEMYEFRDEASCALKPKSARPTTAAADPESWTFEHLDVALLDGVTHVQFASAQNFGAETVDNLRQDFSQLAAKLVKDSKVLFDFEGVDSFCVASINELALFNKKLRNRGSRIALCCLDTSVHESFFNRSNADEKQG